MLSPAVDRAMVVRGMGTPITIHETLTLGESEYLPEQSEVRHVVARDAEGPVEWTTEPVAQHVHRECVKVGSTAILPAIEDQFESPVENIGTRAKFGDDDDSGEKILVDYTVWKETWERTVKSTPNIDFDDLVAVTPRSVQATVELMGQEYSRDVPVFVQATEAALL